MLPSWLCPARGVEKLWKGLQTYLIGAVTFATSVCRAFVLHLRSKPPSWEPDMGQ